MIESLLIPNQPFLRSAFTTDRLDAWLASYPGTSATRRKAHAAMSGFAKYLRKARVINSNPLTDVEVPRAGPPRCRYEPVSVLAQIALAQPAPFNLLSAIMAGTGIEVSVAIALQRRDIDTACREIRARGTKSHSRDRIVRVSEWAWASVLAACAGLLPNAPLFPDVTRWSASNRHRAACRALGIADYRMHDHRHSWAVRAARAGTPSELIARQLGHSNAAMVHKVYGRFIPNAYDRAKWERIATEQDALTMLSTE
jgi:integrase